MKRTELMIAVLVLCSAVGYLYAQTTRSSLPKSRKASQRTEDALIEYLGKALTHTGKAVRVYFHGTCDPGEEAHVLFPVMELQPPANGQTGIEAVRYIFRNDKDVTVVDDGSGIVRIWIGSVSSEILNTRLTSLKLTEDAQYNPDGPGGAIDMIEGTPTIKTAMERLRVRQVPVFYVGAMEPDVKTLPHLPPEMKNITADQVLDSVAKTFPGVVLYGECAGPSGMGLIDIEFKWFGTGG